MDALCSHSETDYRARSWKDRLSSWSTYAAAAGAALATTSSAEANIIFVNPASPVEVKLGNPPLYTGNQRSTKRFTVAGKLVEVGVANSTEAVGTSKIRFATAFLQGIGGGIEFFKTSIRSFSPLSIMYGVKNFRAGQLIGGVNKGTNSSLSPLLFGNFNGSTGGKFLPGAPGFAGFQTSKGDLGWIQVEVLDPAMFPHEVNVIDWAYNNTPGAPIDAAQTPEPSSISLALLATGAAGLLAWRRKRSGLRSMHVDSARTV